MRTPAAYAMHEGFVAPARPRAAIALTILGVVMIASVYVGLGLAFFVTVQDILSAQTGILPASLAGSRPLGMFVLLFSFAFMSLGVALTLRTLHKRVFATVFGPLGQCIRDFGSVSVMLVVVMAVVFVLPPWGMDAPLVPNLGFGTWIMLLLPAMVFVLIQTSAEEIVFRGYLQQQLAARFASPLVWVLVPSVLFGLMHWSPDLPGEIGWVMVLWATLFGALMADLTARAGTLGPAMAVHFWNNVAAILVISLPDELSGLALYVTPFGMDDVEAMRAWMPVDFVSMLVLWLAARLGIRR